MAHQYDEDELYRTSTQYRFWSFTPTELAALRSSTHTAALDRASHYLQIDQEPASACLSLEDEVRLVQRYCDQLRTTSDFFSWPISVKATAVQYLKRFYLTNSVMTYPPKEVYKTVLFLASKTEAVHMSLAEYARRIKTDRADILAPEYKIIQSLRFTLDVRHPYRGLRGILMELLNFAIEPFAAEALAALPPPSSPPKTDPSLRTVWTPNMAVKERPEAAYDKARKVLDAPALLSDAYLLFTPPQLAVAALVIADTPLAEFYITARIQDAALREQVLHAVAQAVETMSSLAERPVMTKEQRAAMEERLEACRDPGTRDLIGMDKAVKANEGGDTEEKRARKAAEAAAKKSADDVFGPAL